MKSEELEQRFEEVAGTLTTHVFLLENIFAQMLSQREDPLAACDLAAKRTFRQFEDLPVRSDRPGSAEQSWRIQQHGLHRLERFWTGVEDRIRRHLAALEAERKQSGKHST